MKELINDALSQISDRHIAEAVSVPKKRRPWWLGAVAAAVAAVVIFLSFSGPMTIKAEALVLPSAPRISPRPQVSSYEDQDQWRADCAAWDAERVARNEAASAALSDLTPFFAEGSALFLNGDGKDNLIWSPANAFMGLSALTELTGGTSRQQLLKLFAADSVTDLRSRASAIWENVYQNNGYEICTLANSLWIEDGLDCRQDTLEALGHHYYASVYRGDLGSSEINNDICAWLNNNTGGLLKGATDQVELDQQTLMALYSTIYFQAKWTEEFAEKNNTNGAFHAPNGDTQVTYMNKQLTQMFYYWGEDFGAVSLSLKNGSSMWFILPDKGLSVSDVLESGEYMSMVTATEWENKKYMKVNLSVPKFDVSGTQDLRGGLERLGITDVFDPEKSDFSAITANAPLFLSSARQSVRVLVDEKGVKAAAYIELPEAGAAPPPDEIIDFILDRPFLFVITRSHVPLFAGTVNTPA